MKPEFATYLEQFGITPGRPLFAKAERLLRSAEFICPDPPETIFLSEFTKDDGVRELLSFWIFTNRYTLEGKNFSGTGESLDVVFVKNSIIYLEIQGKEYDFWQPAMDASRLTIIVHFAQYRGAGILRASKVNCTTLANCYSKYLKPNIIG